jgi:DnaJ-class molecular chaperone
MREKTITCPICKGMGSIPLYGKDVNLNPCPRCKGKGKVVIQKILKKMEEK